MTTKGSVEMGRGSIIVPVGEGQPLNSEELYDIMSTIADEDGVVVHAAITGRTAEGIDFGGNYARPVELPQVLMPVGEAVRFYDAGELWHLMDYRMNIPVMMRDVGSLRGVDWSRLTHLVLPDGNYSGAQRRTDQANRQLGERRWHFGRSKTRRALGSGKGVYGC